MVCLMTFILHSIFLGDQIEKKNEMLLECNSIGGRDAYTVCWEQQWDCRIILKWIFRKWILGNGLDGTDPW